MKYLSNILKEVSIDDNGTVIDKPVPTDFFIPHSTFVDKGNYNLALEAWIVLPKSLQLIPLSEFMTYQFKRFGSDLIGRIKMVDELYRYNNLIAQPLTKGIPKEQIWIDRFGSIVDVDDTLRYCRKNMYYTLEHFLFDGGKIYYKTK